MLFIICLLFFKLSVIWGQILLCAVILVCFSRSPKYSKNAFISGIPSASADMNYLLWHIFNSLSASLCNLRICTEIQMLYVNHLPQPGILSTGSKMYLFRYWHLYISDSENYISLFRTSTCLSACMPRCKCGRSFATSWNSSHRQQDFFKYCHLYFSDSVNHISLLCNLHAEMQMRSIICHKLEFRGRRQQQV